MRKKRLTFNLGRYRIGLMWRPKWSIGVTVEGECLFIRLPLLYLNIAEPKREPGRRLIPRLRLQNYRRAFPQMSRQAFHRWFEIKRMWSGKLVYVHIRHFALVLDYRDDWVRDMVGSL